MFVLIQIVITVCPIIFVIFFSIAAYKFDKALNERKCIREKQISFKRVGDFFPKKIRKELEADKTIVKRHIEKFLKAYRRFLLKFIIYITFWVFYIIGIVIRVVRLFNNYYESKEQGCVIASILMSILLLYWFLLNPIFEFLKWKKLSDFGYLTWEFISFIRKKIVNWVNWALKLVLEFIVSLIPLCGYIYLIRKILDTIQCEITFWLALVFLMVYQYLVLKIGSYVLQRITKFIIKKLNKFLSMEKYTKGEIMYLLLKNCTYLSMVVIYAVSVDLNKSSTPFAAAMGVLFLFDTFLAQEKAIQEKFE